MTLMRDSAGQVPIGGLTTTISTVSPNQPKTSHKCFRIPQEEYDEALAAAQARDETLTSVVRAALKRYVKATAKREQQK
jgi:hypothetical protein